MARHTTLHMLRHLTYTQINDLDLNPSGKVQFLISFRDGSRFSPVYLSLVLASRVDD